MMLFDRQTLGEFDEQALSDMVDNIRNFKRQDLRCTFVVFERLGFKDIVDDSEYDYRSGPQQTLDFFYQKNPDYVVEVRSLRLGDWSTNIIEKERYAIEDLYCEACGNENIFYEEKENEYYCPC